MTKKALLDTNILIYLSDSSSPFYIENPEKIFKNKALYISDRSLLEFYRVFTGYLGHTPAETLEIINFYLGSNTYTILYSNLEIDFLTFELAEKHEAKSDKIFDLNILATAIENKIDVLYTKNIKDYPNKYLKIIDPTEVL